jgi:hypothetical protein
MLVLLVQLPLPHQLVAQALLLLLDLLAQQLTLAQPLQQPMLVSQERLPQLLQLELLAQLLMLGLLEQQLMLGAQEHLLMLVELKELEHKHFLELTF